MQESVSEINSLWGIILRKIQSQLNDQQIYDSFFGDTKISRLDGNKMIVAVSTDLGATIIDMKYRDMVERTILDVTGTNFEIEFNRITDYGGGSTETSHETGFANGNEYLGYDDPNYPVYMVLDEDGTNHRYYELSYGAGFNDHKEYWAYPKFNTAFFISGYNYGFMTKTLSSLLSEFEDSFEAISDEGQDAFVSDSVKIPFDLEFAAEYARKSDWTSFSYFAKESYPDWELDDFKIVPDIEQGEIVTLTITYNAKAVWGEYGNSGKVDFNISKYARFETSIVFSNFGGVTITPPEGVNRQ